MLHAAFALAFAFAVALALALAFAFAFVFAFSGSRRYSSWLAAKSWSRAAAHACSRQARVACCWPGQAAPHSVVGPALAARCVIRRLVGSDA